MKTKFTNVERAFFTKSNLNFRATHGLVYLKEMTVEEFLNTARTLEESIEGSLIT